ncbi:hypothetical protein LZ30DRAFT_66918 [Colletotrichum cereale]|nr:hypothetical protein LZ30DRAFT_66918 [Colletotrichum cereale]
MESRNRRFQRGTSSAKQPIMSPASLLPIPPSSAHCRGPEAGEVRDVEAAVAAPRAVDKRQRWGFHVVIQAFDLGVIAHLTSMPVAWVQSLPPPFTGLALPSARRAAAGGGRRDDPARRVGYRPPAVSSGENRFDACGGHSSGVDENITTSSEANLVRRLAADSVPDVASSSVTEESPLSRPKARKRYRSHLSTNQAKERRGRVETALKPLCDMAPFVLMCAGDPERAVVVPVAVGENADAVDQWTAIRKTSRSYLSRWRSWLGPARLELVHVSADGQASARRGTRVC